MGRRRRENIAAVKRRTGSFQMVSRIREMYYMSRLDIFHCQAQNAVIRTDKVIAIPLDQQRPARAAHAGVDNSDMNRSTRKISNGMTQGQCTGKDTLRRNFVSYVNDMGLRIDAGNNALHDANEGVVIAEVGG